MSELSFLPGPGGWVQVNERGRRSRRCFVHFKREKGRWQQTFLILEQPTPESVRAIPLRRIVLAVNAKGSVSDSLEARLEEQVPRQLTADFYASFSGYEKPEPIRLKRPSGRKLDDDFYREVADVYQLAVVRTLQPRAAISEAAGVSSDVAGRWIHEARKRGLIPKTTPGKVTV
jgi:hypothetical protein